MEIHYCDLCDCVLNDLDFYTLYVASSKAAADNIGNTEDYSAAISAIRKQVREICPKCQELIEEMFRLRKQNLNAINRDLLGIYDLACYDKKTKKKDKK